jgi:hypothetical protein
MPIAFLVVESGTIVESGRHDELLRKGGTLFGVSTGSRSRKSRSGGADRNREGVARPSFDA